MSFESYIQKQLELHPSIQPQDIAKLCYQAAFGAEHLLMDSDRARKYFDHEYESTPSCDTQPLYEQISDKVCRVNLAAWKAKGLSAESLFDLFVASATVTSTGSDELFLQYLSVAEDLISNRKTSFLIEEWNIFFTEYQKSGMPAVHHSETYRQAEHPAYRIVRIELFPPELR